MLESSDGTRRDIQNTPNRWSLGSLRVLLDVAALHGVAVSACLEGTRISPDSLEDPSAEIDASQEIAVVRNLLGHLRQVPALGLECGSRYRLTTFGIWGYVLLSSPTLRAAVEVGGRYLGLVQTLAEVDVSGQTGEDLELTLRDENVPEDCRSFLIERDMAAVVRLLGDLAQSAPRVRSVEFRADSHPAVSMFADYFGCAPSFGGSRNHIVVEASWADTLLPQADEPTRIQCEAQCRELLASRSSRSSVAERVRHCLLHPGASTRAQEIASRLGMSSRTLRRKLADEDTTLRALVGEVRQALAIEMLRQGLRVEEVAERLGYAEPASFIHAFRGWTGSTPGRFRSLGSASDVPQTKKQPRK